MSLVGRLGGAMAAVAAAAALAVASPPGAAAGGPPGESHRPCGEWGAYGRVPARTFDYDCPSAISSATASTLAPLWLFKTTKTVTASPVVAGGRVFVGDWSATMYALDADTGEELWRFQAFEAPGAPFGPIVATAAVADVDGRSLVVFGSGPTMHALDAATGEEVWSTYVGSAGDPADHPVDEQTEFESSPVVVGGVVYSGLDVHNRTVDRNHGVRGGVLAFDLATGEVLGRFDPEWDFVDDVTGERLSGCSSVWSSPAVDPGRGLLWFATGNCPHDLPAGTDWGRHVEAVSAIDADPSTWADPASAVRWTFTPEPLNRDDTDFGATPNLFVDASGRELLGIGKKNAVYYALDPDTGEVEWSTRVTEPGNVQEDFAVGGFIGSTATGRGGIFGGTAIGFAPPYFHALDGATGEVRWSGAAGPSYAASAHVNDVVVSGALDDLLKVWDARTGRLLWSHPLAGPVSSGPAIVGDRIYVGSGTSSSDLCAKDTPGADACLALFDETLGSTGGVHAFALTAPGHAAAEGGTPGGGVLLANEGNRTWAVDLATLERRVILRSASDAPGHGRDVNGQVCFDPARPGHYVAGEDTGQPEPPPGWGYFRLDGSRLADLEVTQVGKLTPRYLAEPDSFGCGFLADGRLVTTTIGARYPGQPATGQLLVWFPPFNRPDVPYCAVDSGLATAGGVLVDDRDRILVAANRPDDAGNPGGVWRYTGDLPRSVRECTATDPAGAPAVPPGAVERELLIAGPPTSPTPSAVAASGRGTLYVSSVFSGTIAEHDADGAFLRHVLVPSGVPGLSTGTPYGMAVGPDGTLYYADLGVLGVDTAAGLGTVRRIRFDDAGEPLPPETLNAGLDFPDGVGLVPTAQGSAAHAAAHRGVAGSPTPAGSPAAAPADPASHARGIAVAAGAAARPAALARTGAAVAAAVAAGLVALALALRRAPGT